MPTVVIIEDHEGLRAALVEALRAAEHYDVRADVSTGGAGLTAAAFHQPDVVILDHHLPDRTGADVLPELRAAAPSVRVVLWTAEPAAVRASRVVEDPDVRVVSKADGLSALLRVLRELLPPPPLADV